GPANALARPLREALDTDQDGRVSRAELVAGVKKFFADCDRASRGSVDRAQLAEGLTRILPRPPAFPGGFPGGPGGPAPVGQVLPGFLQERLNLTAEQQKQVAELQKEMDARLSRILTGEQRKVLQAVREQPGRPGGPGGPPGGGAGGLGNLLAGAVLRRA